MHEESATSTYLLPQPFEKGVALLRRALAEARLRITGELNMSGRIRRSLLIGTTPCVVLFAAPENGGQDPAVASSREAVLTPLHVVASAKGSCTEVHILRVLPRENALLSPTAMAAFRGLQSRLSEAIGRVAMRAGIGV